MLAEQQVSTMLEARCPGCRSTYPAAILPFLYADELGPRCPGCGHVLIVGSRDGRREASSPCRLVLSEGLEGSGLQGMLAELAEGGEGLRVLVDRTGWTRTVRPISSAPTKGCGFAMGDGTR